MFQIGKTIVSEDLIEKDFVCNLGACKGECCIAGEAGAPLEKEEVQILGEIYDEVKPFLRPEGIAAIEKHGTSIVSELGDLETPLVNGAECAYVTFTEKWDCQLWYRRCLQCRQSLFQKTCLLSFIPGACGKIQFVFSGKLSQMAHL